MCEPILLSIPWGKLLFSDFIDIFNKFHSDDNKQLCKNATFVRKHGQMNNFFLAVAPVPLLHQISGKCWTFYEQKFVGARWNSGQTVMKEAISAWNKAQQGSSAESQLLA